uniref:Splicing factor 3a subunit 2 n=1 Tax=Malurus cyaneus samueli TaxID=2593467 RepID=A0A8C5X5H0_9PASS
SEGQSPRGRKGLGQGSDSSADPYFMKNHLGSYECKLCLTLHNNEGSYLAHTQGKKHQTNLMMLLSPCWRMFSSFLFFFAVTKQRDPETGQQSLLFQIDYPEIAESIMPRHRFMSAYEQRIEPPDRRWQYLLMAAEPYETIAFKVPSREIDKAEGKFWTHWNRETKQSSLCVVAELSAGCCVRAWHGSQGKVLLSPEGAGTAQAPQGMVPAPRLPELQERLDSAARDEQGGDFGESGQEQGGLMIPEGPFQLRIFQDSVILSLIVPSLCFPPFPSSSFNSTSRWRSPRPLRTSPRAPTVKRPPPLPDERLPPRPLPDSMPPPPGAWPCLHAPPAGATLPCHPSCPQRRVPPLLPAPMMRPPLPPRPGTIPLPSSN